MYFKNLRNSKQQVTINVFKFVKEVSNAQAFATKQIKYVN